MNEELDRDLESLNAKVDAAIAERKEWMDAHMKDYAKLKVGDEIYDLQSGRLLGTVTSLYRYAAHHNPFHDNTMSVEYSFETSPNCIDNTSRYGAYTEGRFGSREEARRVIEEKVKALA